MLGNDQFFTCRQTDANCHKIDNGSLGWPTAGCGRISDPYLETLVEKLVAPHTSISTHKPGPATGLKAEEL
jgi:hypothetical protein